MHSFAFPRITRKERDETRSNSVGRSGAIPFICACQQRAYVGVELRIAEFFLELLLEQRAGDVMPAPVHIFAEGRYDTGRIDGRLFESHREIEQVPPLFALVECSKLGG